MGAPMYASSDLINIAMIPRITHMAPQMICRWAVMNAPRTLKSGIIPEGFWIMTMYCWDTIGVPGGQGVAMLGWWDGDGSVGRLLLVFGLGIVGERGEVS